MATRGQRPLKPGLLRQLLAFTAIPLLLVSCANGRFTTHGSLSLTSRSIREENDGSCSGTDGAKELTAGAQVKVSDASGTTIAIGHLDDGYFHSGVCTFTFIVPDIPAGKDIYGISINEGDSRQFTSNEMRVGPSIDIAYKYSLF